MGETRTMSLRDLLAVVSLIGIFALGAEEILLSRASNSCELQAREFAPVGECHDGMALEPGQSCSVHIKIPLQELRRGI